MTVPGLTRRRRFSTRWKAMTNNLLLDSISGDDIKATGDKAWEETMAETHDCDAECRVECTCLRTEEYKKRAREIRREIWGDAWDKPIEHIVEKGENQ